MKNSIYFIFLLITIPLNLWGQKSNYVTSSNGKFFGYYEKISKKASNLPPSIQPSMKTYEFRFFNISTKKSILTYQFYSQNRNDIKIKISHDGKTIAIKSSHNKTDIINAITQQVIRSFITKYTAVEFPYYDHCFFKYDSKNKNIQKYDTYSGKLLMTYNSTKHSKNYGKFWTTKDDKYIIQQKSNSKLIVWEINKQNKLKSISATDFKVDYANNHISFVKDFKVTTYDLKTFKVKQQVDLKRSKKSFTKQEYGDSINLKFGKSLLSHSGNFFITPYSANGKNSLMLSSTQRDENKEIPLANLKNIHDIAWLNDSILIINNKNNTTSLLDLYDYTKLTTLDFDLPTRKYKAEKKIEIAHNYDYYILNKKNVIGNKIELHDSKNNNSYTINNVKFISYTPTGKDIIAINTKTNKYGVISLNKATNFSFIPFDDSSNSTQEVANLDNEEEIPIDYDPHKIRELRHISELKDSSAMINLILNNVEYTDSTISINTHLIDKNGIYYYGASSEEWKHIWCNFLLKHKNNPLTQITDFEIIEHSSFTQQKYATAILMDHSGSMGKIRAKKLQEAVVEYINEKDEGNAVALIKFDHKTGIESFLSTNKTQLLDSLKLEGLKNYGGGTSILDAISSGISIVNRSDDKSQKSIILLTDGVENSSFSNKADVIRRAIENDISIYIIGYGMNVDEKFLKSVSEPTNGKYYKIYREIDFSWIYNDIDLKMKNYYEIKFKSDQIGNYQSILKVCISENQSDTLAVQFKNFRTKEENDSLEINADPINLTSIPDIVNFGEIKTNSAITDTSKDSILTAIETEF